MDSKVGDNAAPISIQLQLVPGKGIFDLARYVHPAPNLEKLFVAGHGKDITHREIININNICLVT